LDTEIESKLDITFTNVAREIGIDLRNVSGTAEKKYIIETVGAGACWFDYDNDDDMDLYVVNGSTLEAFLSNNNKATNVLYRNDSAVTFTDVTQEARVGHTGWGVGCAVADIDNDSDEDLFVTNFGPNVLYLNNGNGTFTEITQSAGVDDARWGAGSAFGDYDNDGYVDLYVTNYLEFDPHNLPDDRHCQWKGAEVMCGPEGFPKTTDILYHNNGDGTFTDVSKSAGIVDDVGYGLGVIFCDYDNDGDSDIYVANDSSPNFLFRNNGNGTFTDVALISGVAYSEDGREQAGMGIDFGDYDNDGDQDLFVTNFSDDYNTLYRNEDGKFFTDVTTQLGINQPSYYALGWGTKFFDYDNDGDQDIFAANGHVYPQVDISDPTTSYRQRNHLFRNDGNTNFKEVSVIAGAGMNIVQGSRGAAFADYDDDGDIDIFVVNDNELPNLLRNDGGNKNNWLKVKLIGTKSNRNGIGAKVLIQTESGGQIQEVRGNSSYLSFSDIRLHFGLDKVDKVNLLEVHWPSGIKQKLENVDVNVLIVITEESLVTQTSRL